MLVLFAFLTCIGAGIVGGVFFAFSAFVMRALAQLPSPMGVAAMQRINVVVLNPLFLGVFFGTAVVALGSAAMSLLAWSPGRSVLLLAASGAYVVGTFLVTLVFNVPMNERLARLGSGPEAAVYRPEYVARWTMWNHVRCVAAAAASALGAAALAV